MFNNASYTTIPCMIMEWLFSHTLFREIIIPLQLSGCFCWSFWQHFSLTQYLLVSMPPFLWWGMALELCTLTSCKLPTWLYSYVCACDTAPVTVIIVNRFASTMYQQVYQLNQMAETSKLPIAGVRCSSGIRIMHNTVWQVCYLWT